MAQLSIRLEDDTRASLDALARARGVSTSDLIRTLIDDALQPGDRQRQQVDPSPRSLSAIERRTLLLQHETLALLHDQAGGEGEAEAGYHRLMVEALNGGFSPEYVTMFQDMHPELSRRESDLVHDILQMFQMLHFSINELSPHDRSELGREAEKALTFAGFDFNDAQEARLHSYAQYLIKSGGYRSLAPYLDNRHQGGNSHWPWLAAYQRMLAVWRPMRDRKLARFSGGSAYTLTELRTIHSALPELSN